jgi:hypothetical protein
MVNPTIYKKTEKSYTPTEDAKKLFQAIYRENNKKEIDNDDTPKIRVSDIISKMSFYYEKIRNAVEYEEEHLLRKNAIERILKRQIIIESSISFKSLNSLEISKHLLTELIRAGYLPNNKLPETKIYDVSRVIDKYLKLKFYCMQVLKDNSETKKAILDWLMALDASEIEEMLGRSVVDTTVVQYYYNTLVNNVVFPDDISNKEDRDIQIYIGIHRSLLKFDKDMLGFILLKYYNANWQNPTDEEIKTIANKILALHAAIDFQINHPLTKQVDRLLASYTLYFTILRDVIEEDPTTVYEAVKNDVNALARKIKAACSQRYKSARSKLWRAAVRSIIYIFITKSFFAVLLEVPATQFFGETINKTALAINVSFPALLLFFIVLFTKLPSESNSQKIVDGIKSLVLKEFERQEPFRLRTPIKRSKFSDSIFGLVYSITFLFSVGFVVWALSQINFNWVSITIFLFFLLFVSFFSIRIRKNARDYIIIPPKENILNLISDFFYIPIVAAGKWLSEKFSRINVFVFILDFIIEAPFKIFVEIAEEWTRYVKERKDEIV